MFLPLLNKDTYKVPEEAPIIILDCKYTVCMYNDGEYTIHTRYITKIVHFVRNGEKCKKHNIDWCEGGLQLTGIATKNVVKNELNPRMKYIMVSLEN